MAEMTGAAGPVTTGERTDAARLAATVAAIQPADAGVAAATGRLLDGKTKPRGSLGRLEEIARRVAAVRGTSQPGRPRAAVVVVAADHGYAQEGVSAYPAEVTGQMVANFAGGGAAVCVLARQAGARVVVVDAGTRSRTAHPGVWSRRLGDGTRNATRGPAMSRERAYAGLVSGIEIARRLAGEGIGVLALGEMGIGNSTSAAALAAALLPADAAATCGRGTGVDDAGLARKVATVRAALAANAGRLSDPVGVLAALGGYEIATLAGVALGAAAARVPVVLDGFITGAAALVASRLAAAVTDSMIAGHRSVEPGHTLILDALGLSPVLELDMRLGEGSGAVLALGVIDAAMAILAEMATFDGAGVTDAGA